jgi:glycosyltransferase involved in cell wall biosynthesis
MLTWHIITGEYPPIIGGVSGYSQIVAEGLAGAGDEVHVWCPSLPEATVSNGVSVHPELGGLSAHDLRAADRLLDRFSPPRRLLVQWVPHGFGYRSMNVGFCLWIRQRARRGDRVEIMVHEPYLAFGEGALKWTAAASVHRLMTVILARSASRIWIAIPDWERRWRPYALGREVPFEWLPIPSTLPAPAFLEVYGTADRPGVPGGAVVGHLSSYGADETRMLAASLPEILERAPTAVGMLLGQKSEEFRGRLLAAHPQLASRLCATGTLASDDLARCVRACDVLVQPYPDGITSRRTSAMAGLALGVPVVTTTGRLTEPLWQQTRCVSLVPAGDSHALADQAFKLLSDEGARREMAALGRRVYTETFDVRHTIAALRGAAPASCALPS